MHAKIGPLQLTKFLTTEVLKCAFNKIGYGHVRDSGRNVLFNYHFDA
jgi:hypothetical protein